MRTRGQFDWSEVTASVLRWPELNAIEALKDQTEVFPLFDDELANHLEEAIALDKKHGFSHMLIVSRSTTVYHRLRLLMVTGVLHEVRISLAHDAGQEAFDPDEFGSEKDDPRWPSGLFNHSARECARLIRANVARLGRLRAASPTEETPRIAPRDVRTKAVQKYDERLRITGTTRSDGHPNLP